MVGEFFGQIILFLLGLFVELGANRLPEEYQKWLVRLLGVLLILASSTWLAFELGQKQCEESTPFQPEGIILSKHAEIFDFDGENTSGWKPLVWDTGWTVFEKGGNIEIVDKDFVLDDHSGPFLKYPLDLESPRQHHYRNRNAIYKPVDEKVIGVLANIFYESEDEYIFEEIHASFMAREGEVWTADHVEKLIPNRWNTIVWSLYGPVWWGGEDKDEKWNEFKGLFDDEVANIIHPGARFDHFKIDSIGIQFYVHTEDNPKKFKGTAYIDNIALIYESP